MRTNLQLNIAVICRISIICVYIEEKRTKNILVTAFFECGNQGDRIMDSVNNR